MFGLRTHIPLWVASILLVVPAKATTTYYVGAANEAAFNAAVGGLTLLNPALTFSGVPGVDGLYNASGTGIDFLGFDEFLFPTIPLSFTVVSGKLTATQGDEQVKVVFPAGIYAFGFHITLAAASGTASWCIEWTHGLCTYAVTNTSPANVQFFGVVGDTPITGPLYVRDSGFAPTLVMTNFEAFSAAAVPEPHTMLLVGLGLIILPVVRRKRVRRA